MNTQPSPSLSVAPMLDYTDRHARYFLRLFSPHAILYTEMVTTGALLHQAPAVNLAHHAAEKPLVLQLGGNDPVALAKSVALAEAWGYDAVNLNVGCPSDRVQSACFGAALMAKPQVVATCVEAMVAATTLPITVKTRLGIDEHDDYEFLKDFIEPVAAAGCQTFVLHARKAWLQGLSPKQNRTIPPLCYERVYQVKQDFPELEIILNGGVKEVDALLTHLNYVDGVMIGREAYHHPYLLAECEQALWGTTIPSRMAIMAAFRAYLLAEMDAGTKLSQMTRHILGLFQGLPGARAWRRHLSEQAPKKGAGIGVVDEALEFVL